MVETHGGFDQTDEEGGQEGKAVSFCDAGGAAEGGSLSSRAAGSEKTVREAKRKGKLLPVRKSTTYHDDLKREECVHKAS